MTDILFQSFPYSYRKTKSQTTTRSQNGTNRTNATDTGLVNTESERTTLARFFLLVSRRRHSNQTYLLQQDNLFRYQQEKRSTTPPFITPSPVPCSITGKEVPVRTSSSGS